MKIEEYAMEAYKAGRIHMCSICINRNICKYAETYTFACSYFKDIPLGPVSTPISRNTNPTVPIRSAVVDED